MAPKDNKQVWRTTLAQIEVKLDSPAQYKTFFQNADLHSIEKGTATIVVPNPYTSDWLQQKYHDLIKDTIAHVYGRDLELSFVVQPGSIPSPSIKSKDRSAQVELEPMDSLLGMKDGLHASVADAITKAGLNSRHTMASYILGESNRIAHAAAQAVIDSPGTAYNPLFIYGPTGVGKTHLAQSVARAVIERNPSKKVIYTTSEGFLNDMVKGLKTNGMERFRAKYRPTTVLILDDIQLISKWVATQGEFFNTFNEMHNNNSQIILIADRRPEEIKDIEDRLRSRFQGGMVVNIQKPDYELRLAILQKKAASGNYNLSPIIVQHIAKEISDNIRELEGALQTVSLFNQMKPDGTLTTDEVSRILGIDKASKRGKIKSPAVLKTVAKSFGVNIKDIKGPRRTQDVALARQVCMYILREEFGHKLEDTARYLSRKDHTTVLHAVDKVKSMMLTKEGFNDQVAEILRKLLDSNMSDLS